MVIFAITNINPKKHGHLFFVAYSFVVIMLFGNEIDTVRELVYFSLYGATFVRKKKGIWG